MAILAFGISHKTAPVDLREQIAFPADNLADALREVRQDVDLVDEIAILSTCNRTELYCALDGDNPQPLLDWLSSYHDIKPELIARSSYAHWNESAAHHLMRVAAGLDSQVLGEPQILGQVKSACELARAAGTLGPQLTRLSNHTLNVAKRVRTDTDIGRNPISVAYAGVTLAQQIFGDLDNSHALLIGAGDTIELVARHLRESGIGRIIIANRTLANARELANACDGEATTLEGIPRYLPSVDVVIASTGSAVPVLGKGAVEEALRGRRRRPMFMLDIAVPRDIEAQVSDLPDVYLYTVDDISAIIEDNLRTRREAAEAAEQLVLQGVERFIAEHRARDVKTTLTRYRNRAESIQHAATERALRQLRAGKSPEAVVERLARELTNKLLHHPTVSLRKASADGRIELIEAAHDLLDLGEHADD